MLTGAVLVGLALIPGESGDQGLSSSTYKKVWAASLVTVALGFAADVVPELTGWFAVAVIVGAVLKNPGVIGKFINKGSGATSAAATTTTGGATA
jgi:hypothetical protein